VAEVVEILRHLVPADLLDLAAGHRRGLAYQTSA
jgi:hypothetical protein